MTRFRRFTTVENATTRDRLPVLRMKILVHTDFQVSIIDAFKHVESVGFYFGNTKTKRIAVFIYIFRPTAKYLNSFKNYSNNIK